MLARNLGMSVIAEGIETKAQLEQLKAMTCDQGQDYYFSKPLSPQDAFGLLEGEFIGHPVLTGHVEENQSARTMAA